MNKVPLITCSPYLIPIGISINAGDLNPSESVTENLHRLIPFEFATQTQFIEYKIDTIDDAKLVLSVARTSEAYCTVHAPDILTCDWLEIIDTISQIPRLSLVNVHARPDDSFTLCQKCSRRMVNTLDSYQCCGYCDEPLSEFQLPPEVFNNSTEVVVNQLLAANALLEPRNIRLSIENTYEPPNLLRDILRQTPANIGFTFDVGHSLLYYPYPSEYLYELRNRLFHLHLHDNMGGNSERYHDLHLPPGEGISDWNVIHKTLARVNFHGTATLECSVENLNLEFIRNFVALPAT